CSYRNLLFLIKNSHIFFQTFRIAHDIFRNSFFQWITRKNLFDRYFQFFTAQRIGNIRYGIKIIGNMTWAILLSEFALYSFDDLPQLGICFQLHKQGYPAFTFLIISGDDQTLLHMLHGIDSIIYFGCTYAYTASIECSIPPSIHDNPTSIIYQNPISMPPPT